MNDDNFPDTILVDKDQMKSLGSFINTIRTSEKKTQKKGAHSELHEVIATMRKDFGETAKKGKGSFGFYLGLLRKVPLSVIYQWLGDIKDSPNLDTPLARAKIFWWKYKIRNTSPGKPLKATLYTAAKSVGGKSATIKTVETVKGDSYVPPISPTS